MGLQLDARPLQMVKRGLRGYPEDLADLSKVKIFLEAVPFEYLEAWLE